MFSRHSERNSTTGRSRSSSGDLSPMLRAYDSSGGRLRVLAMLCLCGYKASLSMLWRAHGSWKQWASQMSEVQVGRAGALGGWTLSIRVSTEGP